MTHLYVMKATATKTRLTDAGWWLVVARGGAWKAREVDEGNKGSRPRAIKQLSDGSVILQHGDCS